MDGLKTVCDIFDIAYDAACDIPRITVLGQEEAYIENFVSLEEYKKEEIKLKCKRSIISLSGQDFSIKAIKENCILIRGKVESIKFM